MKVVFLTLTDDLGASSRYRVYQYIPLLKQSGVECILCPAVSNQTFQKYSPDKGWISKVIYFTSSIINRILKIRIILSADIVFIQRLVLPHIYPFLEVIIARLSKKVVFDFDDAIFYHPPQLRKTLLQRVRDSKAVARVIGQSDAVVAGNEFLKVYAAKYNDEVFVIPTSIDIDKYIVKDYTFSPTTGPLVIGWIGSPSTAYYLKLVTPVLARISQEYQIVVQVIGANLEIPGVRIECKTWALENEVEDLLNFDIGIMPLTDDEFTQGKCGAKLLQYMAVGVPGVASPIGVNKDIIKNGYNGFLADTEDDWYQALKCLIADYNKRYSIGIAGRKTVEEKYSIQKNAGLLYEVLRIVAEK